MNLSNKVAIVTGASSGIGRATAIALARKGVRLVLASRNEPLLHEAEEEARTHHAEVFVRPTDVASQDQVQGLVRDTVNRFGTVDIAVASAGQYVRGRVSTLKPDDFEQALRVNFFGTLYLALATLPVMKERGSGFFIAVSSVDGKKGLPLDAPYVASKFAVTGFMDVLRQELRGSGVRALTILPGRVDTPMIANLDVPWVSRKISSERVARAILRGITFGGSEVIVPFGGPTLLVALNGVSARSADWLTRLFRLEGVERKTS